MSHAAFAILVLAMVGCTAPKADTVGEANAIRERFGDWVEAEKRRDVEASVSFLTPDAIIQGEGAPAMRGHDAARAVWKGFFEIPYTDIEDVEPRTVVVSQSGDLAYDIGSWRIIVPSKNGPTEERGKSAIAWEKRDGKWMAVAISFSMDAPPAPLLPSGGASNR